MGWARPCRWLVWSSFLVWMVFAERACGARGTFFRGEWSLGSLIGALIVVGVLVGIGLFLAWPNRRG